MARRLICLCCMEVKSINAFPHSAVSSKYQRVCYDCKQEQREQEKTHEQLKEMNNDPDYHAFMRQQYDK